MAQRIVLASALAAAGTGSAFLTRSLDPPYRVSAYGGFTGNVTLQHSPDKGTTWVDIGTIASGADISVPDPMERLRVSGTHTGDPATIVLFADSSGIHPLN